LTGLTWPEAAANLGGRDMGVISVRLIAVDPADGGPWVSEYRQMTYVVARRIRAG